MLSNQLVTYWLYQCPDNFADLDIIRICGIMCNFTDDWQVTVESVAVATQVGRSAAVLIPAGLCPRSELIKTLTKVVEENIAHPVLQRFVKQVLSGAEIISRFVTQTRNFILIAVSNLDYQRKKVTFPEKSDLLDFWRPTGGRTSNF